MFPLTIADLSKQGSRSGFDVGHQNAVKQSKEGVLVSPPSL